jgi:hypothetical protein
VSSGTIVKLTDKIIGKGEEVRTDEPKRVGRRRRMNLFPGMFNNICLVLYYGTGHFCLIGRIGYFNFKVIDEIVAETVFLFFCLHRRNNRNLFGFLVFNAFKFIPCFFKGFVELRDVFCRLPFMILSDFFRKGSYRNLIAIVVSEQFKDTFRTRDNIVLGRIFLR